MSVNTDPKKIDWFLNHGVQAVLPEQGKVLRERMLKGERLRAYLGIDATGPSVHIGHAISAQKLGEWQALGHEAILLLGDFTGMIGDPTDKTAARTRLTREQTLENLKDYKTQLSKILRFDGENPVQIRFNSEWLGKMSFADVVELAAHFTVQQMMERDMFEKRLAENKPIFLQEFLYPLMQGQDSVALDVDLEIGGNDQTFNMLAGRTLMREISGKEKAVMTCRLLTDPTGKKMGKTEGNMIALSDAPEDAYGKMMSWPDTMILPGFEILTSLTGDLEKEAEAIAERRDRVTDEPMALKKELAEQVVRWGYGDEAATQAAAHFASVHQEGAMPEMITEIFVNTSPMLVVDALTESGLVASKTDARRQIEQGAVKVEGVVVTDVKAEMDVSAEGVVLQKGKRGFAKLIKR
ncbi:tyrosine--tRNA ligase [Patescibacteria group bacterium]|nr:tyrosine--tRNA ligase [Patescibacteria group bacterium]